MIGVDEVGRGCWAGPLLVVAARAQTELPPGVKDSKLMTRSQREEILDLLSNCCSFSEGWVSSKEIDFYGLSKALRLGGLRALKKLAASGGEEIILDGKFNYLPKKYKLVRCIVDADVHIGLVSAAGIYAKVRRDNFMYRLKQRFPVYGFENHVGYGTLTHRNALRLYGPIKNVHRMSFKPLQELNILT